MKNRLLTTLFLALFILTSFSLSAAVNRNPSPPYISGDGFRAHCDFIFDETSKMISPRRVHQGATIFVKTDLLDQFLQIIHPQISTPYILVTHNSDHPAPGPHASLLDDDKIIAWFGQNVENYVHPKLHPIPIGIANRQWLHGNPSIFSEVQKKCGTLERTTLLYMNFSLATWPIERSFVWDFFSQKPYCTSAWSKALYSYLNDLIRSSFVLSPRGNGLDCHRTWEALYMGAIPIVRASSLDSLFENLPVVIVKEWEEVTEEFLHKKQEEFSCKRFDMSKIYIDYWIQLIDSFKTETR